MKRLNKILRLLGLIGLILLASLGIGAPISFNTREKFMDYKVRIEQVDKKDDECDEELKEVKE